MKPCEQHRIWFEQATCPLCTMTERVGEVAADLEKMTDSGGSLYPQSSYYAWVEKMVAMIDMAARLRKIQQGEYLYPTIIRAAIGVLLEEIK